jgi:cytochrome c oxidase assembly protein subunit 15
LSTSTTAILKPVDGATADLAEGNLGAVATWLFVCCALIFLMVVIGGITRLTISGLSITEWKPVVGVLPPLSPADWAAEFAKYKEIPEYRIVHYAMSLDEFKTIYFWEYLHRLLGRLVGVAYGVPFVWFFLRRRLPRSLVLPLAGILLLGFGQGALGWFMVASGLADRAEVSQYRLVAHLALALAIYAAILWMALGLLKCPSPPLRAEREGPVAKQGEGEVGDAVPPTLGPPHPTLSPRPAGGEGFRGAAFPFGKGWRRVAEAVILLVALTIAAGGLVAGTHAGLIYNTFPLMDGALLPPDYFRLHPPYLNWFENVAAIQFDHRALALATAALISLVWAAGLRTALPRPARFALHALLAVVALQVGLGIATLLLVVPIPLAAAHQTVAVLLLTAAIVLRHTLRRTAVVDAETHATI